MKPHPIKADLLLILVTLLAACGWVFSKETLQGLPPIQFIGSRFLLAGVVLGLIGAPALKQIPLTSLIKASSTGLVFAIAMIFWILGLHHGHHVGEGAFITSMGVVLVPLIARFFFAETPARETWIALPIATTGLALLSLNQGFSLEAGQIYFLIAAVIFALHFNLTTKLVATIAPLALSAIQLCIVGIVSLGVSFTIETWPSYVDSSIWIWFLASALIATCLRFWLQTKAQSFAPASHVVVILTLEPIWTAILASLWFDETMTTLQFSGCTLIFSALLISRWRWLRTLFFPQSNRPKI
ncbi:MAG: DMT family transporter [Hahellaceae bacterium]|nr:DMT family transporter [Hahellaceae bacterium]MCP5212584.1 DMT family transporter [Hahellaceae bacterium]